MTATAIDWTKPRQPCPLCDKGPKDDAFSTTKNPDGSHVGYCHRCGYVERDDAPARGLSPAARAAAIEAARRHEQQRIEREQAAAARARALLARARPAPPTHPYLLRKGIRGLRGLLVDSAGHLLVPMFVADDPEPINAQTIDKNGEKRFLAGGRTRGAYACAYIEPLMVPQHNRVQWLAEGWGTGVTVALATGAAPVYCSMSASNLPAVAEIIKSMHPDDPLVVAADHDEPGLRCARACSDLVDAVTFPDTHGRDWNDEMLAAGLDPVALALAEVEHGVLQAREVRRGD